MTFLWPLSTVVVCYNLCFDSLPGVKGTCQGSSPVYGHMVDMLAPVDALAPANELSVSVIKCFADYFPDKNLDAIARCIKAAFQAEYPKYIASVKIGWTDSTNTGYVFQGSSEDCELFVVWEHA